MKEELFKGQYALSVFVVVCTMVFINIIFRDSIPFAAKAAVGAVQILVNVYLLVKSIRIKSKELTRIFTIAFILNAILTFGGLYLNA